MHHSQRRTYVFCICAASLLRDGRAAYRGRAEGSLCRHKSVGPYPMAELMKKVEKNLKKYLHYVKSCSILNIVRETQKLTNETEKWLRGQAVKTLASHAGIRGSIPLGVTEQRSIAEAVLFSFFNQKLEIVFFSGISYNREVLKNPRRGIRIGGEENVSISNRNASESKSRPLCSGPVQHQQP